MILQPVQQMWTVLQCDGTVHLGVRVNQESELKEVASRLAAVAIGETAISLTLSLSIAIEPPTKGRGGGQQNDRTLADG